HHPHLGLLQHDFRQPYPVGRARVLPGQVVAAAGAEPGEQAAGEAVRCVLLHCFPPSLAASSSKVMSTPCRLAPATSISGTVTRPSSGGSGERPAAPIHAATSATRRRPSNVARSRARRSSTGSARLAAPA